MQTHRETKPHTYTRANTHIELFLVEPVACLSSGLLWVLAALPVCLSPLPQSAALPFNKRHLNLNTQAQSSLSFNLPLKANNFNNTFYQFVSVRISTRKILPNPKI